MGIHIDSERAHSPNTRPTMIRHERREVKRRMLLLSLLACFLFLTLVAFRRPKSFMSEYTYQTGNSSASVPSRTKAKTKSWLKGIPKSKGPILGNGERRLSDTSLADLKNTSLGVCEGRIGWDEELSLTTLLSVV